MKDFQTGRLATLPVYNRAPLILASAKGTVVADVDGVEYEDFVAGIAVNALGYGDAELTAALKETLDKGLLHCSNLYWNPYALEAAGLLVEVSGMQEVFFCNSGTEANEAAIKLAHKWGSTTKGNGCTDIISMEHSFHGRTCGALAATGQEKYRKAFEPLVDGFSYAVFNDLESVRSLITPRTCAIMVEGIQGEGGIVCASDEFLAGLHELCHTYDLLLIMDEVQCGMGRTGHIFSWQKSGVRPDVMTLAKGLGGGIPVGALVVGERAQGTLVAGDHGSTFGGNLLAMSAACVVLKRMKNSAFLGHVEAVGAYLEEGLRTLASDFPSLAGEVKGRGLLRGLKVTVPPADIVDACRQKGVLIASAGSDVLRFVPPLTVSYASCDILFKKLREIFTGLVNTL